MRSSCDRKREQRKRDKMGIDILHIEVRNRKTLCEMFREMGLLQGGDHVLPHTISGFLDEMGGKYRKRKAQERLAGIFPCRTGLADRETEPYWSTMSSSGKTCSRKPRSTGDTSSHQNWPTTLTFSDEDEDRKK
jgi:hypothetical protein